MLSLVKHQPPKIDAHIVGDMKKITVLICDDHTVVRQGLRSLLETAEDMKVIGEAENGQIAVAEASRLQPDVILMDLAMPSLNGVEAARRISGKLPSTRVLILSTYSDEKHLRQAIDAGAAGYLTKETAWTDLLRAIREATRGNRFFTPEIIRRSLDALPALPWRASRAACPLTSRQTEIVQLIAEGYSTNEIAEKIAISPKTVEKHRQSVMNKLDIHEIATLTRFALTEGIIAIDEPLPRQVALRVSTIHSGH